MKNKMRMEKTRWAKKQKSQCQNQIWGGLGGSGKDFWGNVSETFKGVWLLSGIWKSLGTKNVIKNQ